MQGENQTVAGVAAAIAARKGEQNQQQEDSRTQQTVEPEEEAPGLFDEQDGDSPVGHAEPDQPDEAGGDDAEDAEDEPESLMAQLGISEWDRDQRAALAKELGSRVGEQNGELRREVRELRAALESELNKRRTFDRPVTDNPYAKVSDVAELQETMRQAEETIRTGREALEDNEDAASDDVILTVGNQDLTKRDVRGMIRRAQEARDTFIPDRFEQLQHERARDQQYEANKAQAVEAHAWLREEGNPLRARFEQISPAIVEKVRNSLPDLYPHIDIVLADHAYMTEMREKGQVPQSSRKPIKPTTKIPSSPGAKAAPSSRPSARKDKEINSAHDQFVSSGSVNDLAKFLAARKS